MTRSGALAAALLLATCWGAGAAWSASAPSVTSAWARATPPNARSAAVYLKVSDRGGSDQLVGASTPVAASASLHESRAVGGVMQMRAVIGLDVSAGHDLTLAPGGFHIMLTGLSTPLRAGQSFPITLRFRDAGQVTATVQVEKLGATGPAMDMPGMDMK